MLCYVMLYYIILLVLVEAAGVGDGRALCRAGRLRQRKRQGLVGIHQRGVQWERGAVDGGSTIYYITNQIIIYLM